MFNPRTAIVVVAPLVCAALVACRASVGEEVRVTGESEQVADSDPSQPAPPSPKPSEPMLVPSPAQSSNEPGGGAASETAPSEDASTSDAGVDAPADVAPKPSYSCTAPTMSSYAYTYEGPCSKPALFNAGGDLKPGTYFLSQWWSSNQKICGDTLLEEYTRRGTMVIEVIDGITYMRWTLSGTTTGSGTARLTKIDATSLTRSELCGLSKGSSTAVDYWTSESDLVLKRKDGLTEERWTIVPAKIWDPRDPMVIKQ